jgi:hypothetical protein
MKARRGVVFSEQDTGGGILRYRSNTGVMPGWFGVSKTVERRWGVRGFRESDLD